MPDISGRRRQRALVGACHGVARSAHSCTYAGRGCQLCEISLSTALLSMRDLLGKASGSRIPVGDGYKDTDADQQHEADRSHDEELHRVPDEQEHEEVEPAWTAAGDEVVQMPAASR